MIVKVERNSVEPIRIPRREETAEEISSRPSLLGTLYRRRWTLLLTTFVFVALGVTYLVKATPIFTASSRIVIEKSTKKILSEDSVDLLKADNFLYTQSEILRSAPILKTALDQVNWSHMKTFDRVSDPIYWLQNSTSYDVEVGKKDDMVTVSLDSPYAEEASRVVNHIVEAYIENQTNRTKSMAVEMLRILQKAKATRDEELAAKTKTMLDFKMANSTLSFQNEKGNIIVERLASLGQLLTEAELLATEAHGKRVEAALILKDQKKIKQYVQTLQTSQNMEDHDYDALSGELRKYQIALSTATRTSGPLSPQVHILTANIQLLQNEVDLKERSLAEAHLAQTERDEAAAELKLAEVRSKLDSQRQEALSLNTKAALFYNLQADVDRLRKQCDILDARIGELSVNSENSGTLNVQVVDVARVEHVATKPKKSVVLAASLILGLIIGSSLGLIREGMDQRFRSLDDVASTLGLPIFGAVPRIVGNYTPSIRGQFVHCNSMSDVAESYRALRTALYYGAAPEIKTVLVTSPTSGDGKSTVASNLAIAMAQAGNRTLLIDCDFRKPAVQTIYELPEGSGLSAVMAGAVKLQDAIQSTKIDRLHVLPCGAVPTNPSEILTSAHFKQMMTELAGEFDRIVIDTPPVMPVADAQILAASADATFLVVRTNKMSRKMSGLALEALRSVGANVLGVIVNDVRKPLKHGTFYRGRGRYDAATAGKSKRLEWKSSTTHGSAEHARDNGIVLTADVMPGREPV